MLVAKTISSFVQAENIIVPKHIKIDNKIIFALLICHSTLLMLFYHYNSFLSNKK